ncbi:MAG: 16S rRNA (guanine(966)-N(2))-methyltransferase RsmD [Candidatus Promineifilaceae bacterium]
MISGKAKGRKLKAVPGDTTRPIMDRVKENLFNILGDWVIGTRWLDLFAGTGQVGIEALSRGASEVVFVDSVLPAIRTVSANLELTKLTDGAKVLRMDAFNYLERGVGRPFDLIYVAPPQYQDIWSEVLKTLDKEPTRYITMGEEESGIVAVQIDPKEYQELPLKNLELYDQRKYGRTMLCFYEVVVSSE